MPLKNENQNRKSSADNISVEHVELDFRDANYNEKEILKRTDSVEYITIDWKKTNALRVTSEQREKEKDSASPTETNLLRTRKGSLYSFKKISIKSKKKKKNMKYWFNWN